MPSAGGSLPSSCAIVVSSRVTGSSITCPSRASLWSAIGSITCLAPPPRNADGRACPAGTRGGALALAAAASDCAIEGVAVATAAVAATAV